MAAVVAGSLLTEVFGSQAPKVIGKIVQDFDFSKVARCHCFLSSTIPFLGLPVDTDPVFIPRWMSATMTEATTCTPT